ncbi:E3 ubiquitin protein ligase LUL4 [Tanacetum coccineum]
MENKQTPLDERNIIDIIRNDEDQSSKKNWKTFRDKLRLKRAGKAWTSSINIPQSDINIQNKPNKMMIRRGSSRYTSNNDEDQDPDESDGEANRQLGQIDRQKNTRLLPMETDDTEEEEEEENDNADANVDHMGGDQQMSLMSLLSDAGSNYIEENHQEQEHGDEDEGEDEMEDDEGGEGGQCVKACCGCKGKHRGVPLGPCGHTFCKHCTKELHVTRGNCPTCNSFILEILDIY